MLKCAEIFPATPCAGWESRTGSVISAHGSNDDVHHYNGVLSRAGRVSTLPSRSSTCTRQHCQAPPALASPLFRRSLMQGLCLARFPSIPQQLLSSPGGEATGFSTANSSAHLCRVPKSHSPSPKRTLQIPLMQMSRLPFPS